MHIINFVVTPLGVDSLPLHPTKIDIIIDETTIPFANALRKILESELIGVAMDNIKINWESDLSDKFIFPEFNQLQIKNIPINSSVKWTDVMNTKFSFSIVNEGIGDPLFVYSKDLVIVPKPKKILFNPSFVLCFVQIGKELNMTGNFTYGTDRDDSSYGRICQSTVVPVDQENKKIENPNILVEHYTRVKLSFVIKAVERNKDEEIARSIIDEAIDIAKKKYSNILSNIKELTNGNSLIIQNETMAIGYLLEKEIFKLNPDILVQLSFIPQTRELRFIISPFDESVIVSALESCISLFEEFGSVAR